MTGVQTCALPIYDALHADRHPLHDHHVSVARHDAVAAELSVWGINPPAEFPRYRLQRVKADCLTLYEQGRLVRDGKGSVADPYAYSIAPLERRRS